MIAIGTTELRSWLYWDCYIDSVNWFQLVSVSTELILMYVVSSGYVLTEYTCLSLSVLYQFQPFVYYIVSTKRKLGLRWHVIMHRIRMSSSRHRAIFSWWYRVIPPWRHQGSIFFLFSGYRIRAQLLHFWMLRVELLFAQIIKVNSSLGKSFCETFSYDKTFS